MSSVSVREFDKKPETDFKFVPFFTKPFILRIVAYLASVVLLGLLLYQTADLIRIYRSVPTSISLDTSQQSRFPQLTICSGLPISYTTIVYNFSDYVQQNFNVMPLLVKYNIPFSDTGFGRQTLSDDLLQGLLGIWPGTLILKCTYNGDSVCHYGRDFLLWKSFEYLNCYRLDFQKITRDSLEEITLILLSESLIGSEEASEQFPNIFSVPLSAINVMGGSEPILDRPTGAVLFVQHSDYYMHNKFKLPVSTGQSSVVTYSEVHHKLYNHPQRACATPTTVEYKIFNGSDIVWKQYSYTKLDCQLRYVMDTFENVCSCRLPNYPIDRRRDALALCRNGSVDNYIERSGCYEILKNNISNLMLKSGCLEDCSTKSYTTKVTSFKWPLSANVETLLTNDFIPLLVTRQAEIGKYMAVLDYFSNLVSLVGTAFNASCASGHCLTQNLTVKPVAFDNNITRTALRQKLVDTVNSNFVKVTIHAESFAITSIKEELKYNFINLVSEFGGLCGLLLGWSLMSVVELLEVTYHSGKLIITRLKAFRFSKKTAPLTKKINVQAVKP